MLPFDEIMRKNHENLDYIVQRFGEELPQQVAARERLAAHDAAIYGMQLHGAEGRMLQWLLQSHEIKSVVEIGSLVGYSATWIARALPESGAVHAIERNDAHYKMLSQTADEWNNLANESSAKIIAHHGNGLEILKELESHAPFGAVFIDADKLNYHHYFDWAEVNICKNGLIIGDNSLLFDYAAKDEYVKEKGGPSRSAWQAMREFNERLSDRTRYDAMLIPTQEGMTVARKLF